MPRGRAVTFFTPRVTMWLSQSETMHAALSGDTGWLDARLMEVMDFRRDVQRLADELPFFEPGLRVAVFDQLVESCPSASTPATLLCRMMRWSSAPAFSAMVSHHREPPRIEQRIGEAIG